MNESEISSKQFATILLSNAQTLSDPIQFTDIQIPVVFDPRNPKTSGGSGTGQWTAYLTPIYDQGICAGCYSYSTVSCLSDRFAMQTLGQVKPYFNPLVPIMCFIDASNAEKYEKTLTDIDLLKKEEITHIQSACSTGKNSIYNVGLYLFSAGGVEDICIPIQKINDKLETSGRLPLCSNIEGSDLNLCFDNSIAQRMWPAKDVYTLKGIGDELILNIKHEVMRWGPITVAFKVFPDFIHKYDGKTVYIPAQGQKALGGHAVKLIGWGKDYWICANSWGKDWGENGYFKITQGNKDLELEENHMCVIPLLSKAANLPLNQTITLITENQIKIKNFNDVDPITFYTKKLTDLINSGKIKGTLTPVINDKELPDWKDYFAFKLGTNTSFKSISGQILKEIKINKMSDHFPWIIIIFIIIILVIIYYKHIKQ